MAQRVQEEVVEDVGGGVDGELVGVLVWTFGVVRMDVGEVRGTDATPSAMACPRLRLRRAMLAAWTRDDRVGWDCRWENEGSSSPGTRPICSAQEGCILIGVGDFPGIRFRLSQIDLWGPSTTVK